MKVHELMTRTVASVRPQTPFKEAVELLLMRDVSGLPVVDEEGRVVGIVTEADLMSKEAYSSIRHRHRVFRTLVDAFAGRSEWWEKAEGRTVGDVMTSPVVTALPDEEARVVARRMLEKNVKRLPVVDERARLIGILSRHDILNVFHRSDSDLLRAVQSLVTRSLYAPPDHDVKVSVENGVVILQGTVAFESDVEVIQAIVAALEGVIGVTADLQFRERDPRPEPFHTVL